jgi:hypothetical protein
MIVRAIRIRTSPRGPELADHFALRVGAEYMVLEVECTVREKHGPIMFRILDGENDPTMWPADCFELVDGTIPPSWVANIWSNGTLYLAPRRWQRPDFWEQVLDGPAGNAAERIFLEELDVLKGLERNGSSTEDQPGDR